MINYQIRVKLYEIELSATERYPMAKQLYYNGDILTMEQTTPVDSILVEDGLIKTVGPNELVTAKVDGSTKHIDFKGKTLMPSFIDAHSQFTSYAISLLQPSLEEAVSFDDITNILQTFAKKSEIPAGQWIVTRNNDQTNLIEQCHPNREFLDSIFPEHPCVIQHQFGHMGTFNTLTLKTLV